MAQFSADTFYVPS